MANGQQLSLTPAELEALFDILTHAETFHEIRDLRYEANVARFGPPATPLAQNPGLSAFPLLQKIVSTVVSPGFLTPEGWQNLLSLIQRLGVANLSDSYDKGFLGLRKTAATGLAANLESVARGFLAGRPRNPSVDLAALHEKTSQMYDRGDAEQLEKAWDDTVQGMLYGDLLDRIFDTVEATPELDAVPPVARAALDYFLMWYVFLCGELFSPSACHIEISEIETDFS